MRKRKGQERKEKRARIKVRKMTRKEERNAKPAPGPTYAWRGQEKKRTRRIIRKKGEKKGTVPFFPFFMQLFFIILYPG
jgi:hypothetical protein